MEPQGFSERVVDALADYGIPFECTYKAAMEWDTSKEVFASLIAAQFTGAELKELISNDIQLSKVNDIINRCSQVGKVFERPKDNKETVSEPSRGVVGRGGGRKRERERESNWNPGLESGIGVGVGIALGGCPACWFLGGCL